MFSGGRESVHWERTGYPGGEPGQSSEYTSPYFSTKSSKRFTFKETEISKVY